MLASMPKSIIFLSEIEIKGNKDIKSVFIE